MSRTGSSLIQINKFLLWLLVVACLSFQVSARTIVTTATGSQRQYHPSLSTGLKSKFVKNRNASIIVNKIRGGGGGGSSSKKAVASNDYPTWKDLFELPIHIKTKEEFYSKSFAKRVAMVSRTSVLHLTLLSCISPLIFNGAVRSVGSTSTSTTSINPILSILWTINCLSWHMMHNMLNDYQDLKVTEDDVSEKSYRSAYGVHVLKQGIMNTNEFVKIMLGVSMPGIILSTVFSFINHPIKYAFPFGIAALILYTPLFKPFALGEVLVYMIWGPFMAGFGHLATSVISNSSVESSSITDLWTTYKETFTSNPIVAMLGFVSVSVIMGKHTDKINYSKANTLPKLLGYPLALVACTIALISPHIFLTKALLIGRSGGLFGSSSSKEGIILPLGAALGYLTLFKELPYVIFNILRRGQPTNGPNTFALDDEVNGFLTDVKYKDNWPLWFVLWMAWHSISFGYLVFLGSSMEWIVRSIIRHVL